MEFEPVIGLEIHAQLKTKTKMFCGDSTEFGRPPNTTTCPVCLGMPGVLPVINRRAVEYAVKAALALHCTINARSVFARKNYFYPDLTKGYQISQYELPLAEHGWTEIVLKGGERKRIGITRIHMEEDAGKNTHIESQNASLVDYNRCGVPLIEIVSEPDIRSSDEAVLYLKKLRQVLRYLDVCDGNMEEGSLRCDANISLRPKGESRFGTRSEIKNINSFRFVQKAIEFEIVRHAEVLNSGGRIVQETRLFDHETGATRAMRSKEESHDYRYFPEPDLIPLKLPDGYADSLSRTLPELPDARRNRLIETLGLSAYDADLLTAEKELADYFDAVAAEGADAKKAANWVMGDVSRLLNERNQTIRDFKVQPGQLATLIKLVDQGSISGKIAKSVFGDMAESGADPAAIIADNPDYKLMDDSNALAAIVDEVIAKNPDLVAKFKAGNEKILGALVGQIMKATRGQADPQIVNKLLRERLKG